MQNFFYDSNERYSCQLVKVKLEIEWPQVYSPAAEAPRQPAGLAMTMLEGADREKVVVVHVGPAFIPLSVEVVAVGRLAIAMVQPRDVFKGALLTSASSVYVAHNRFGTDAVASPEDCILTRRLIAAGELIGIPVLDHLIVNHTGAWASMRQTTDCWLS